MGIGKYPVNRKICACINCQTTEYDVFISYFVSNCFRFTALFLNFFSLTEIVFVENI